MEEEEAEKNSSKASLRKQMIDHLADTDAHFKHQQRGEPDLTHAEKTEIATEILDRNPAKFLEQFSKFLRVDDTKYFEELQGNYAVDFYVSEILKRHADTNQNVVKNRRYQAMQGLMADGEYFSEEEMKRRDPLLFQQMIGQYETEEEQAERLERDIDKSDLRFSTILLKHMDTQDTKQFYETLKEREEEQEEEEDEESDEEDGIDDKTTDDKATEEATSWGDVDGKKESSSTKKDNEDEMITDLERNLLKTEFTRIMQERFLAGEDKEFDYKSVDTNADYDSLEILDYDLEEKYFDSEIPFSHRRHQHRMLTESASDSSLSSSPSQHWEVHADKHLRQRIRALELRGDAGVGGEITNRTDGTDKGSGEDDMDLDDYMKFELPDDGPSKTKDVT